MSTHPAGTAGRPQGAKMPALDFDEKGFAKDGTPATSQRRLYLQFLAFGNCHDAEFVIHDLQKSGLEGVLYSDLNDPYGIGLLLISENPDTFMKEARDFLCKVPFTTFSQKLQHSLFGRTYAAGREMDLEDWLLRKPRRNALNPKHNWAVWYPLRRKPEFNLLPEEEQGKILMEHGMIGRAYGESGKAYDIRLACHGLDTQDNDFVLGLVGEELYPLSHLVQTMRKTQQTGKYMQSIGPFFVGKTIWQSPLKEEYLK